MVLALVLLPALAGVLGGDTRGLAGHVGGGEPGLDAAADAGQGRAVPRPRAGRRQAGRALAAGAGRAHRLARAVHARPCWRPRSGIAYGSAELFGVSFALGAFFAGVVLSETDFSHQAAADFAAAAGCVRGPVLRLGRDAVRPVDPGARAAGGADRAGRDRARQVAGRVRDRAGLRLSGARRRSRSRRAWPRSASSRSSWPGSASRLGLLPPEGRDLILAGALLSITLNPLVFAATDRLATWLGNRPKLLGLLERSSGQGLDACRSSPGMTGRAIMSSSSATAELEVSSARD